MRFRGLSERGQFVPIAAQVIFAGMMLIVATVNVYRVSRAKLQAQNMADAAALAVAALEAKEINVVIDRNEWLNHLYSTPDAQNTHRLPNISKSKGWQSGTSKAQSYAQLVATINQAQAMFRAAYERFLGADSGDMPGQNSGPGSLQDILSEIEGLKDPSVTVVVYNSNVDPQSAEDRASALAHTQNGVTNSFGPGTSNVQTPFGMKGVPFETVPVTIRDTDKKKDMTLAQELGAPTDSIIGWMRPKWEDSDLRVNASAGKPASAIGAGVIVVKKVTLLLPMARPMYVKARAQAFVVQESGLSVKPHTLDGPTRTPEPPDQFRPTYYVKLGARS